MNEKELRLVLDGRPPEYPPWLWAASVQLFLEVCLAVVKDEPLTVEHIAKVISEYHEASE